MTNAAWKGTPQNHIEERLRVGLFQKSSIDELSPTGKAVVSGQPLFILIAGSLAVVAAGIDSSVVATNVTLYLWCTRSSFGAAQRRRILATAERNTI